jgi:nicotinate-nucleotide pyrophosphorylase (carboxylating)
MTTSDASSAAALANTLLPPLAEQVAEDVRRALAEDIGSGDLTAALIAETSVSQVVVSCREDAVLCGAPWFEEVFRQLDQRIVVRWKHADGHPMVAGSEVCAIAGSTRALLSGERTALNFLQTLSATATLARRYAQAVAGSGVRILDTRKTLPGLRMAQKYAVRCGGCANHRIGLFDAILIKENHIQAAGSISAAVARARAHVSAAGIDSDIEIEVESLAEFEEALAAGAQRVLLDNFSLPQLHAAVRLNAGRARLEASGGVDQDTVREIARTGVDDISVGALTKDIKAVDLSMRFIETI